MLHVRYIRAVAEALEAAGVPVADHRADAGVAREGWIPFDLALQVRLHGRPVWDHDEAGVAWHEETGWRLHCVDDPGGRDARTVTKLDVPTLAAPQSVAGAVVRLAALPAAPRGADPRFPDRDFPDHRAGVTDPAFEKALQRYE